MIATAKLKDQIRSAFAAVKYPGGKKLRGSEQGDEPFMVEREFYGKNDWSALSPEFIDGAPQGLGSALSFFSDAAFRFYLPAYLIADIDGRLVRSNPVFHLTHGLDSRSKSECISPKGPDQRTWYDYARSRFAGFTSAEAGAIAAFLEYKLAINATEQKRIEEALIEYWYERAA